MAANKSERDIPPDRKRFGLRPFFHQLCKSLLIALCCGVSLAQAQVVPRQDYGCSVPLAACTQRRVEHLLRQSSELAAAAALKPPAKLSARDQKSIDAFDGWLRTQSAKARSLAQLGRQAADRNLQMSFNLQYLQLQARMQDESRRYTLISNVMKTKHDTAKNSIGNVR